MKQSNSFKILIITLMLTLSSKGSVCSVYMGYAKPSTEIGGIELRVSPRLLPPRLAIPPSLVGRITESKEYFQNKIAEKIDCNTTDVCATYDSNITSQSALAWMGFELIDGTEKYFVSVQGQDSTYIGNKTFATPKWDKRHFWMNMGKDTVPVPLLTRVIGPDEESDNIWYAVNFMGYRQAGIDYSNYSANGSLSVLILLVNPQSKKVVEYYIETYNENGEYTGEDNKLEIGDALQSYFLGFNKKEPDTQTLFSAENLMTVTGPITFNYTEQYPGKDFNCTRCKSSSQSLDEVEFQYIFELILENGYGKTTTPMNLEKKSATSSNSTSKSVPLSSFWLLFLLTLSISIQLLKKDKES